jgi:Glycosyl hydrolase family 12
LYDRLAIQAINNRERAHIEVSAVRKLVRSVATGAMLALAVGLGTGVANAVTWTTTAPFGSFTSGAYTMNNDVWGSGAGPQTMWANSGSNWGVTSDQPATNGVKSYPHAEFDINKSLTALHGVSSKFNVTVPGTGVYNTAYDIWLNNNAFEVMLWMNEVTAGPLGTLQQTVTVGGFTWQLYAGSNGANEVYSFINTGQTSSGTVDVLAVLKWLQSAGRFGSTTATLGSVQFGWEISSTGGVNRTFTTNSYSVTSS